MTVSENILAKLTAEPITKIVGESDQGEITILESEFVAKAAKIKTTDDMVENGWKYGFLVIVLGKTKNGVVINNPTVQWTSPKDPGGCNKSIQPKDSNFYQSMFAKSLNTKSSLE